MLDRSGEGGGTIVHRRLVALDFVEFGKGGGLDALDQRGSLLTFGGESLGFEPRGFAVPTQPIQSCGHASGFGFALGAARGFGFRLAARVGGGTCGLRGGFLGLEGGEPLGLGLRASARSLFLFPLLHGGAPLSEHARVVLTVGAIGCGRGPKGAQDEENDHEPLHGGVGQRQQGGPAVQIDGGAQPPLRGRLRELGNTRMSGVGRGERKGAMHCIAERSLFDEQPGEYGGEQHIAGTRG